MKTQNEAKHTPELTTRIDGASRLMVDHGIEGEWVVGLTTRGNRRMYDSLAQTDDVEARATLYASAPELLDAHKKIGKLLRDQGDLDTFQMIEKIQEINRAAIKKAEGR